MERSRKTERQNPYESLYGYVHPLVFGAVDRASSLSLKICRELLRYHISDDAKIAEISERLNGDYPAHEYPILFARPRKSDCTLKNGRRTKRDAARAYDAVF